MRFGVVTFFFNKLTVFWRLLLPLLLLILKDQLLPLESFDFVTVLLAIREALSQFLFEVEGLCLFVILDCGRDIDWAFSEYLFLTMFVHLGIGHLPLVIRILLFWFFKDALVLVPDLCCLHLLNTKLNKIHFRFDSLQKYKFPCRLRRPPNSEWLPFSIASKSTRTFGSKLTSFGRDVPSLTPRHEQGRVQTRQPLARILYPRGSPESGYQPSLRRNQGTIRRQKRTLLLITDRNSSRHHLRGQSQKWRLCKVQHCSGDQPRSWRYPIYSLRQDSINSSEPVSRPQR